MRKKKRRLTSPSLRFSPWAWAKLLFLRDQGPTEIGGFGIATEGDSLFIEDIVLLKQSCTAVHVSFDDAAVADFFDEQIDLGRRPEQFARIWVHTHPGNSAQPSLTDETTFSRVFGSCDWAVMAILAKGGQTYARLRFSRPRAELRIPVEVNYSHAFPGTDFGAWNQEYRSSVVAQTSLIPTVPSHRPALYDDLFDWHEFELTDGPWALPDDGSHLEMKGAR